MNILKLLSLTFFFFLVLGCSHMEIYNGYKPISYSLSDGFSITFSMDVTPENIDGSTTVYGEPYTLIIDVFYTEDFDKLSLHNVVLKNAVSDLEIKLRGQSQVPRNPNEDTSGSITFKYTLETLSYVDYQLTGRLVFEASNRSRVHDITVRLETGHKEKKINKFWENLMGM